MRHYKMGKKKVEKEVIALTIRFLIFNILAIGIFFIFKKSDFIYIFHVFAGYFFFGSFYESLDPTNLSFSFFVLIFYNIWFYFLGNIKEGVRRISWKVFLIYLGIMLILNLVWLSVHII